MSGQNCADLQSLLDGLNEPQRQAVCHTDGPLLVLAGPGSGKTRVITRRAAYLASTVTKPRHILAITFTNKAAREMKERIDAINVGGGMTVSTFHAFCARLLREHASRVGISRAFTIVDQDDRRKIIRESIERCGLSDTNWTPARIEPKISLAKNDMFGPDEYASRASDFTEKTIARIYAAYDALLRETDSLDFDDLLFRTAWALESDSGLRDELQDRYRYVLIDEYQDTNRAQYRIARLLTDNKKNICATGDPDQSIYGWRGADIGNILSFERDFSNATVVRLEQNYRSTKRIVSVADRLIAGNTRRKEKTLWTENEIGAAVRVLESETYEDEADTVADEIAAVLRQGVPPSEVALFYRVNSLSRTLEQALIRKGIGYQIARGVEFFARREIKDVLAYLRILVNPADDVALTRIINTPPRGIGDTTVGRLVERARASGRRLLDIVLDKREHEGLGRSAGKIAAFAELLRSLTAAVELPISDVVKKIISESGLRAHYRSESEADNEPWRNMDELVNSVTEFQMANPQARLLDWLEQTALVADVDSIKPEGGVVTLMTLHAAKGLEFSHVFIVGVEDGLLPLRRLDDAIVDMEEERRLCFVGCTRARKRLTLSLARYRMMRGVTERTVASPFLDEIGTSDVEWLDLEAVKAKPARPANGRGLPDDLDGWQVGTLVRHPLYGLGRVLALERGARRTHVDVQFRSGERHKWVLEFATLERVEFDEVD